MTPPAAMYTLLSILTERLCVSNSNVHHRRQRIRRLVSFFLSSRSSPSVQAAVRESLRTVADDSPRTFALRCLAVATETLRRETKHEETMAAFDGVADALNELNSEVNAVAPAPVIPTCELCQEEGYWNGLHWLHKHSTPRHPFKLSDEKSG